MSIPADSDDAALGRFGWALRLSPLLVAVILAVLWLAGAPAEVPDLRLSAPVVARPGSSIGVRAWQVDRDDEGYTVIRAPDVAVELRNPAGMSVARAELSTSKVHGAEGRLEIDEEVDGPHTLVARASIDGSEVTVERTVYVREGIDSRLPAGRAVNAFQVYELEPLRIVGSARAPEVLDPRVEEGACVPDLQCTLVVWVGDWAGRVRVRPLSGVRVVEDTARAVDGFARLSLQVQGQEGRVAVEALADDGGVVASRQVRLPVVPGGLLARASTDGRRVRIAWESLGGPRPVLVDVFEDHRWIDARSLTPEEPSFEMSSSGVRRVQVRTDLFSDDTAAVTYTVIADSPQSDRLRAAAEAVVREAEREGLDPLAMAVLDRSFSGNREDAIRAMFAVPCFDVVAVGLGVSARVVEDALDDGQDAWRWLAAGLILLIGFVVSMVLLRVELVAQARALQLLDDLGPASPLPRRTVAGRGLWAFVFLVFVLMAVLALSKRWF